jgi:hypothetical protein
MRRVPGVPLWLVMAGFSALSALSASAQSRETPARPRAALIPAFATGPAWNEQYRFGVVGWAGTLQIALPAQWNVELHGDFLDEIDVVPIVVCVFVTFPLERECEENPADPKFLSLTVKRRLQREATGFAFGLGVGYGGMYERHLMPLAAVEWQFGRRWGPRLELRIMPLPGEPGLVMPGTLGFRIPLY